MADVQKGKIVRNGKLTLLVLSCVGFGGLLGFSRMFSLGFVDYLASGVFISSDAWYLVRTSCSVATLLLLALAGRFRWFSVSMKTLAVATALMIASAIVFAVDEADALGPVVAVVGGVSNAVLMYVWLLLLSRCEMREILLITFAGAVIGAIVVLGASIIDPALALIVAVASAFAAGTAAFMADPDLVSCKADGPLDETMRMRVPWLTVIMVLACSFLSATLYGVAEQLTWLYDWRPNALAFAASAIAAVAATFAVMLRSQAWMHIAWVPLFALFALAIVCSCLPMRETVQVAVGFMVASVLCANFLPWGIFASLLSSLKVPRAFLAGIVLVFANSSLATLAGRALGSALPRSMQNLAGVSGVMAIALATLLVVAFVVSRHSVGIVGVLAPASDSPEHGQSQDGAEGEPSPPADPDDAETPADALRERVEALVETYGLTPRETEVALLTVQGFSCAYIADKLVVSNSTVRFHQQNIYRKLEVHSRNELIEFVNGT